MKRFLYVHSAKNDRSHSEARSASDCVSPSDFVKRIRRNPCSIVREVPEGHRFRQHGVRLFD